MKEKYEPKGIIEAIAYLFINVIMSFLYMLFGEDWEQVKEDEKDRIEFQKNQDRNVEVIK